MQQVPDYESEKSSFEHWRATYKKSLKKVYFTILVQLYINEIWTLPMLCSIYKQRDCLMFILMVPKSFSALGLSLELSVEVSLEVSMASISA